MVGAAPTTEVDLKSLNFPSDDISSMLKGRDASGKRFCPPGEDSCGVVTFKSGQYTSFGEGICMQLGNNVESIYVAKCYCSLWK